MEVHRTCPVSEAGLERAESEEQLGSGHAAVGADRPALGGDAGGAAAPHAHARSRAFHLIIGRRVCFVRLSCRRSLLPDPKPNSIHL